MTLKVIESGEIVHRVFWLDLRTRRCGLHLWDSRTGRERCGEVSLANVIVIASGGRALPTTVENVIGERAEVILRDE